MSSHDEQDDVDDSEDKEEGDELFVVAPVHQAELLWQRVLDTLRYRLRFRRRGWHQPFPDTEKKNIALESDKLYCPLRLVW